MQHNVYLIVLGEMVASCYLSNEEQSQLHEV